MEDIETQNKDALAAGEDYKPLNKKKHVKRIMNPYIVYRQAHHERVKAENPELDSNEVCKYRVPIILFISMLKVYNCMHILAKKIGEEWRALSLAKQQPTLINRIRGTRSSSTKTPTVSMSPRDASLN